VTKKIFPFTFADFFYRIFTCRVRQDIVKMKKNKKDKNIKNKGDSN